VPTLFYKCFLTQGGANGQQKPIKKFNFYSKTNYHL